MTRSRGYLTMAVGDRSYLELAVDMALSLREHTRLPVALATDEGLERVVAAAYPDVFDHVTLLAHRFRTGRARKYGSADASPFEETVFIDADCIVLGELDSLFDVLATESVAMLGEYLTPADGGLHHGFSTRALMARFALDAYLKTNSGIFAFRRPAALEVMEECLLTYRDEVRPRLRWHAVVGGWLGDEITFGIVGGRRRFGMLPRPSPMFWPNEFADIDLTQPNRALLHFIGPLPEHVLEPLIEQIRARRSKAGLPSGDPAYLRREMATLEPSRNPWRWAVKLLRKRLNVSRSG